MQYYGRTVDHDIHFQLHHGTVDMGTQLVIVGSLSMIRPDGAIRPRCSEAIGSEFTFGLNKYRYLGRVRGIPTIEMIGDIAE